MSASRRSTSQVADAARLFDGGRLTLARHLAGLRKNALAALIDRTPTSVAGYENGSKRPTPTTVAKLALALSVEPEFFLPGPAARMSDRRTVAAMPHFRSLRSTSQIVRDQAFAFGLVLIDVTAVLERHVELPGPDLPHVTVPVDQTDDTEAENAARLLRSHWKLGSGPVGHLVRIAELHGVVVVFGPPQAASLDAYSFDTGLRPVVLLNPVKHDYYRQRFDLAHELGHLVMHEDAEPGGRAVEEQAHRFAAELLMPADELADLLPAKADWPALARLKEEWGVSMQALLYRARTLGVMRDVTYRNAMTTLSANGWRRREPGPMPSLEQPSLLPRAVQLLDEVGVDELTLASECRVPLPLLRQITARTPTVAVADDSEVVETVGIALHGVPEQSRVEADRPAFGIYQPT